MTSKGKLKRIKTTPIIKLPPQANNVLGTNLVLWIKPLQYRYKLKYKFLPLMETKVFTKLILQQNLIKLKIKPFHLYAISTRSQFTYWNWIELFHVFFMFIVFFYIFIFWAMNFHLKKNNNNKILPYLYRKKICVYGRVMGFAVG